MPPKLTTERPAPGPGATPAGAAPGSRAPGVVDGAGRSRLARVRTTSGLLGALLAILVLSLATPAEASASRRNALLQRAAAQSRAQRLLQATASSPRALAAGRITAASLARRGISVKAATAALRTGGYWDRYFARALAQRTTTVQGPNAVRILSAFSGNLPDSPFVDYLRWRRSLNPSRFDHYHPGLGSLLEEGNVSVTVDPPVVPPIKPEVPEPSTWLLGAVLAVAGIGAHRRARWSTRLTG